MKINIKTIPNFPNYAISEDGKIWSNISYKFLKPSLGSSKYFRLILCKNKKHYHRLVHRLVLETFVGPCPARMECRHLDGNRQNNNLENLRWGSRKENVQDALKHGKHFGNKNAAKLIKANVKEIISLYKTGNFLQREIAATFGVSRRCISHIINSTTWKDI